ncbi:hypothetical protein F7R20_05040 [Pseudomonas brassicacearum subsp. brassicacearum]|nr:hypothetical protein F7R20_05040 [Pseudomonas brassicacearum subsp. brassicacearum]QEO77814.1 hypothetical protein ELZ14_09685 [Pseudomonas brassicacearum]
MHCGLHKLQSSAAPDTSLSSDRRPEQARSHIGPHTSATTRSTVGASLLAKRPAQPTQTFRYKNAPTSRGVFTSG